MHFVLNAFSIVVIDLLLAGDNALVIAMAVRSLTPSERRIGTISGAAAAVLLRVGLTAVAAQLLQVPYLQLIGGVLVVWIAVKVLRDACEPPAAAPAPRKLLAAIWYIVLADITMSADNILAIAGASKGSVLLIVFGLAVSIPFVVLSSNLLAHLMDRYPWLVYLGAGILGKVGGDMVLTDPAMVRVWSPGDWPRRAVEAALALTLIATGYVIARRREAA
jgi:YjbE family integral membrane protein